MKKVYIIITYLISFFFFPHIGLALDSIGGVKVPPMEVYLPKLIMTCYFAAMGILYISALIFELYKSGRKKNG